MSQHCHYLLGNCLVFNCLRHPDRVIISDPVSAGEEMRTSGSAAGIWSEMRRTDDNIEKSEHKTQSALLKSDARSDHGCDNNVEAWSRVLRGRPLVTEEVFSVI